MRKLLALLIIGGALLIAIAPFTLTGQLQKWLPEIYDKLTHLINQQETTEPKLEIKLNENNRHWETKNTNNLPELISQVDFSITNIGDAPAKDVAVVTKIEGETINSSSIELLKPSEAFSNTFTISLSHNSAKIVTIDASTNLLSATKTLIIDANVTRKFSPDICRSFVTPQDQNVIELKNQILKDKTVLAVNWMALRDWVGTNMKYKDDLEVYGKRDFWQFPNETIPLKTGDCEDFSLLLCSLLRADGWSTDNVYVVIGEQDNMYHAWVRVIWNDLEYNIEPQANGFAVAMGDLLSLSGYNAKFYFNDENLGSFD
jgi:predicted transglutaminase-like cysteine proteinase